jgi:hypothetical protein
MENRSKIDAFLWGTTRTAFNYVNTRATLRLSGLDFVTLRNVMGQSWTSWMTHRMEMYPAGFVALYVIGKESSPI